jgi:pilus assembly protein Flp/PilA
MWEMNDLMLRMYLRMQTWAASEDGQDLVEYALVVALIAFGAVAAMQSLSGELNNAFAKISSTLSSSFGGS